MMILVNSNADQSSVHEKKKKSPKTGIKLWKCTKTPIENGRGYQTHPALPTRKDMRTHPPRTPTVLAQQLHVPVAPGWNDANGADHNGRSTVLLCPRLRPGYAPIDPRER